MIVNAKVKSVSKSKKGITALEIVTTEIKDHISWCGQGIQMKLPEYVPVEVKEDF